MIEKVLGFMNYVKYCKSNNIWGSKYYMSSLRSKRNCIFYQQIYKNIILNNDKKNIYQFYYTNEIHKGRNEVAMKDNIKNTNIEKMDNEVRKKNQIKFISVKSFSLSIICFITTLFFYCTLQKVPEGYICLLENKEDKTVLPYIYDDLMTFFFNPLKYNVIFMRIMPIHKKYTNIYETVDKKKVQVKLEIKLKPKISFIREIYSSFGINYSTNFIKKELDIDIKNVIKDYKLDTLINLNKNMSYQTNEITADDVIDNIVDRFYDTSIFYKIVILDVLLTFEPVNEVN
ncbi:prohibitin-like protein, putative [Plasmodium vinckei brucechwatti]|uniref:Prohibitin-like protein, putative n=1 Tax=Plasmodium vinckei brucechwatti TaxID=119398 RepID=A0A6V7S061_PLAVN|nr:prohibitin-like protein, putative [Plasmodium vinckei brucechwatti]